MERIMHDLDLQVVFPAPVINGEVAKRFFPFLENAYKVFAA